jgi:hypothetical protein
MCKAWDPQQLVETLFKQIQDCADFYETGGVEIVHPQQIEVGYAKIYATCNFMSACCRWNEREESDKMWKNLKAHFAAAHLQKSRCKGNQHPNQATMQKMQLLANMNIKWLKPPLAL